MSEKVSCILILNLRDDPLVIIRIAISLLFLSLSLVIAEEEDKESSEPLQETIDTEKKESTSINSIILRFIDRHTAKAEEKTFKVSKEDTYQDLLIRPRFAFMQENKGHQKITYVLVEIWQKTSLGAYKMIFYNWLCSLPSKPPFVEHPLWDISLVAKETTEKQL